MSTSYWNEEWTTLAMPGFHPKKKYEISNYGRIKSYAKNPDGSLLKAHLVDGYPAITFRMKNGKASLKYIHKLVAQHFLEAPLEEQKSVIHHDYDKVNNFVENLAWADKTTLDKHLAKNPNRRVVYGQRNFTKLTETEVIRLKKRIFDPKRRTRLKMLAKEFGISEMQLYRIKRGENWADVGINPLKLKEKETH